MKKNLGVVLSVLILLAVIAGGYKSWLAQHGASSGASGVASGKPVRLLVGSAKMDFLRDPALTQILAKQDITLELIKSESFEQDKTRLATLDAIWPAGANSANDWAALMPGSSSWPVFSTPLAIASWKPLMPVLEQSGIAKTSGPQVGEFYLDKALDLMQKGVRWNQLQGNTVFNVNKSLLVNTPDLRKSNTAALYIATLAWVQNGHEVVQDVTKAEQLTETLSPLITRQGFQETTLAGPFEDYLGQGMGKAPLVLVYESQFLAAKRAGKLQDVHMLLYPQPGMVLKHNLVARTAAGKQLGELLSGNKEIQKIAAQYGFRTNDATLFASETKAIGLTAPPLLNLADAPATAILDAMTQTLIKKMEGR